MNILLFGPNGSGKGTQGTFLRNHLGVPHIESGAIFRHHIDQKTPLGKQAQTFIDRGELVPDTITIPMMIERMHKPDCTRGWILDGFPRCLAQAISLRRSLDEARIPIDAIIEIALDREVAKLRIMGRRVCVSDNSHPNHIANDDIKPVLRDGHLVCHVCGGKLKTRSDDQDIEAINKRLDIYYDTSAGTLAAIRAFKVPGGPRMIVVDGSGRISETSAAILAQL